MRSPCLFLSHAFSRSHQQLLHLLVHCLRRNLPVADSIFKSDEKIANITQLLLNRTDYSTILITSANTPPTPQQRSAPPKAIAAGFFASAKLSSKSSARRRFSRFDPESSSVSSFPGTHSKRCDQYNQQGSGDSRV